MHLRVFAHGLLLFFFGLTRTFFRIQIQIIVSQHKLIEVIEALLMRPIEYASQPDQFTLLPTLHLYSHLAAVIFCLWLVFKCDYYARP